MNLKLSPRVLILALITPLLALAVWLSPLAFVPVPWPDDSAFYFVAHEFFKIPPRWVMLPQSPFEPSYRIFNFNTMPLYPLLIGLGRFLGIDGSFALKFWPLIGWALSGSLLAATLYRFRLHWVLCALLALGVGLDPTLRWASVLVRPESMIGLLGTALILGLTFGFPRRFTPSRFWDPVSAILAIAAGFHFNAIHLVFPVLIAFARDPKRIVSIGLKTLLYLTPWLFFVLIRLKLFIEQMTVQWTRLAVPNPWLASIQKAVESLFQQLGSPIALDPSIQWAGVAFWILIFIALGSLGAGIFGLLLPSRAQDKASPVEGEISLLPAATWVASSIWIWHTKPEVWFIYYLHLALWVFGGILVYKLWAQSQGHHRRATRLNSIFLVSMISLLSMITSVSLYADLKQARQLGAEKSWNWAVFDNYVECVHARLKVLQTELGNPKPFRVWVPTFPDITIELSKREPDWEFTRVNDFWERRHLAIRHGHEVEAVVVTETLNYAERDISSPVDTHPEIESVWMTWRDYFLNDLWKTQGWKQNRYLCQRGRWQAFLFMQEPKK